MNAWMKCLWLAALCAGVLAGCSSQEQTGSSAPTQGTVQPGGPGGPAGTGSGTPAAALPPVPGGLNAEGKAVCSVCYVKGGGAEPEEVKGTLNYKGKTFYFCTEADKAEFISNPSRYAAAIK